MSPTKELKSLLSPRERGILSKLRTPKKIQDFLDSFPINFPGAEEGMLSPRGVLMHRKAHCMEGAVLAAAALLYHGHPPLLMDFQTIDEDEDHVVALFKENGLWGAISKTNHPVLRWRDPIYKSARELALSYFNEYFMWHKEDGKLLGKKTLRAYSKPFDLRKYDLEKWVTSGDIDGLAEVLDNSPHFPIAPKKVLDSLRPAYPIEIKAMQLMEWQKPKEKK